MAPLLSEDLLKLVESEFNESKIQWVPHNVLFQMGFAEPTNQDRLLVIVCTESNQFEFKSDQRYKFTPLPGFIPCVLLDFRCKQIPQFYKPSEFFNNIIPCVAKILSFSTSVTSHLRRVK